MCKKRIEEVEEEVKDIEGEIENLEAEIEVVEKEVEKAKRRVVPRKKLPTRSRGRGTRDTTVERLEGRLTSKQIELSRLERKKVCLEKELEELKSQGCC